MTPKRPFQATPDLKGPLRYCQRLVITVPVATPLVSPSLSRHSRLAGGFGFERPGIRGLAKMRLRVTMALTIMLAMALGRIRAGQCEHLRSLVRPA